MEERFICIHGHFYQPPRENPWLEHVELQDSAYPFHDWNERITAECYAPNAASRILDEHGRIDRIVNNYERISFNFGPTLLSWMEEKSEETFRLIVEADERSRERFSGHGCAMAQVYNHVIMPLANERDKRTQVRWGLADFRSRFGREPEGMWLSEAAVDYPTLEVLAEHGIQFVVLAPGQALRIRNKSGGRWHDVSGARIDPTMAYECRLPSGRRIAAFFYDGPISQAVAFEGLLTSGERFAHRLVSGFSDKRPWAQLVHIATDGETYGHHHKFGDMALAYALEYIEAHKLAVITNYGEFLERYPPTQFVEIADNSSWSCFHGVERWRSDCGCRAGWRAGWNQMWRGPLRQAFEQLRESITPHFEGERGATLIDPWGARDKYIALVMDRSRGSREKFLHAHVPSPVTTEKAIRVIKLLEMQRHAMLMYTSCGWFFDELSGIEGVQVMQYSSRCARLADELFPGQQFEQKLITALHAAKSNVVEHCDGACVYENFVQPAAVDLEKVGAHYAISSLFSRNGDRNHVYCYEVQEQHANRAEVGNTRLLTGSVRIESTITGEADVFGFGVVHFGGHSVTGGVKSVHADALVRLEQEAASAFQRADFAEVVRLFDREFSGVTYSIMSLFKDEQRAILHNILESTLEEAAANLRLVFESNAPLMNFLTSLRVPQPPVLRSAATFVTIAEMREQIENGITDLPHVEALIHNARNWGLDIEAGEIEFALNNKMTELAGKLMRDPEDMEILRTMIRLERMAALLEIRMNAWRAQNTLYFIARELAPQKQVAAASNDETAANWIEQFRGAADALLVKVE